jgi:hypothetical protein
VKVINEWFAATIYSKKILIYYISLGGALMLYLQGLTTCLRDS